MKTAGMLALSAFVIGAMIICLIKRAMRAQNRSLHMLFFVKPTDFLKEDVYGVISIAAMGLVIALSHAESTRAMVKASAGREDIWLGAAVVLGVGLFLVVPRLWWATGIPQKFLDEAETKTPPAPPNGGSGTA